MPSERGSTVTELSIRQAAFVREYLISGNVSDAYAKAGYRFSTRSSLDASAAKLLRTPKIASAVAAGRKKIAAKIEADFNLRLDDILRRLAAQVTVDRTKLTAHRRGCCRYCWGIEHHYQWKTPREFSEAVELHILKGEAYCANHSPPEMEGGYGYLITRKPNLDCPECAGLGIGYTVFADTDTMSDAERIVFEGVKETRDGIQYVMADRSKALETLGKHLGMFKDKLEVTVKDGQPIQTETTTRVIIVPAKVPAQRTVRQMSDLDDIDPLSDHDPQRPM
jgi:hypothetical protein